MRFLTTMACAAFALALSTPALAQKKAKATPSKLPAHLAALDTLKPVSPEDFSYALGIVQSDVQWQNFVQTERNDSTLSRQAFTQSFFAAFQQPEKATDHKAFNAGIAIAKMTDAMFINNKVYRLSSIDSTSFLDTKEAQRGFIDGLLEKGAFSLDSAKKLTLAQAPYYEAVKVANAAQLMKDNLQKYPDLKVTDSGLQYRIITAGTGEHPMDSSEVKVNYEGRLFNDRVFDSSYKRGEPATFNVSGVIKGWKEILQLMPVGSTWEVFIPENLAYGVTGTKSQYDYEAGQMIEEGIPPYAPLIFKIELIDIIKK